MRSRSHAGATLALAAVLTASGVGAAPAAAAPPAAWPPATGPGDLIAHIGEEHLTDADGPRVLPAVVAQLARYGPLAVTTSADKSDNGTPEKLEDYKKTVIAPLAAARIPVFSATGNHDRTAMEPVPGGSPFVLDFDAYRATFADQPFPWGDAAPFAGRRFAPTARPASDPAGASTHFFVDVGAARLIFVDNSCYEITVCNNFQNPPFPDAEGFPGQLEWMRAKAIEAGAQGRQALVVLHMPTQDDRPGHTEPTPAAHTMGEGTSPDNAAFEQAAREAGVDGVFAGHIKIMQQYVAGGVPYFIDGGAGGELYVNEEERVGVDSGYWYGFRLARITPSALVTDAVPVIVPGGITVAGPGRVGRGEVAQFTATARQPATEGVKVDALELRDPDPARSNATKLPSPARIWTSSDPLVLAPLSSAQDDPRRDVSTQTDGGRFAGRCPGRASLSITSGYERRETSVTVPSTSGPVVRSMGRRDRTVTPGRSTKVGAVRLAQPARLIVTVQRAGRTVATLRRSCASGRLPIRIAWNGRLGNRRATPGRYTVVVRVASDRPSSVRRLAVRVTG